jgi:fructuronate reductase
MSLKVLDQSVLDSLSFWQGKNALLPSYDRKKLPITSLCFSAGRMAYGHTADILQDVLDKDPSAGLMAGVETYAYRYCLDLSASDYLMTQLVYENDSNVPTAKIQGAIKTVLFVDASAQSLTWQKLMEYARYPKLQFATINAPEGAYGMVWTSGEFAEPKNPAVIKDMAEGTIVSDPAKWTAFALERFKANLKFALVSCTNFSGNGHVTGAVLRTIGKAWEEKGFAPKGFLTYLSDPTQFSFPNTMIDRIAVSPDDRSKKALESLELQSIMVVTESCRYWAVEDVFPNGRPAFEKASGVFMCPDYEDVKRYEDMKLRILNMSHSAIAGLGVLLGYRGPYGIYKAMQDKELVTVIKKIIDVVIKTIDRPKQLDPAAFAADAFARLTNPNIPDDPMRIALNGSTKMLPRFMDTYYAAQAKGMSDADIATILLPVAGFLRYTMAVDDAGVSFDMEGDPIKETLVNCGKAAKLGAPASVAAFASLISNASVMGKDLYTHGTTGTELQELVGKMLGGTGAVRKLVAEFAK